MRNHIWPEAMAFLAVRLKRHNPWDDIGHWESVVRTLEGVRLHLDQSQIFLFICLELSLELCKQSTNIKVG